VARCSRVKVYQERNAVVKQREVEEGMEGKAMRMSTVCLKVDDDDADAADKRTSATMDSALVKQKDGGHSRKAMRNKAEDAAGPEAGRSMGWRARYVKAVSDSKTRLSYARDGRDSRAAGRSQARNAGDECEGVVQAAVIVEQLASVAGELVNR
jgi:hypothetical protein